MEVLFTIPLDLFFFNSWNFCFHELELGVSLREKNPASSQPIDDIDRMPLNECLDISCHLVVESCACF